MDDAADVWFRIQQAAQAVAQADAGLESALTSRVSGLAQAIGSFDAEPVPVAAARLPSVDSAGASAATLAVGDMVDAMRRFDQQAGALGSASLGLQTAPITGLASVGMAALGSSSNSQRIAALHPDNLAAFTVPK